MAYRIRENILVASLIVGAVGFASGFFAGSLLGIRTKHDLRTELAITQDQFRAAESQYQEAKKQAQMANVELRATRKAFEELKINHSILLAKIAAVRKDLRQAKERITELHQAKTEAQKQTQRLAKYKEQAINALENELAEQRNRQRNDYETRIATMLAGGAIHSINTNRNIVRIDPLIWSQFDVDEKKELVAFFSKYFELVDGTTTVTVLSSKNDLRLAKRGLWGTKILK